MVDDNYVMKVVKLSGPGRIVVALDEEDEGDTILIATDKEGVRKIETFITQLYRSNVQTA